MREIFTPFTPSGNNGSNNNKFDRDAMKLNSGLIYDLPDWQNTKHQNSKQTEKSLLLYRYFRVRYSLCGKVVVFAGKISNIS